MSSTDEELRSLIKKMGGPRSTTKKPQQIKQSLYVNVSSKALKEAGVDVDDPQEFEEYWFPEKNVVVFDLDP
jgi:hypothetical protein